MDKPFVHLMETINGYYVFEVNRNMVFSVDKEIYKELKKTMEADTFNGYSAYQKKIFQPLFEQGYLSGHRVKKLKHPATDNLEDILNRRLEMMTLQVTQGCNLRCSYCIYSDLHNERQRSHSGVMMDFDLAKRAVDFFLENSVDNNEINIGFYGGEPLIAFDLIKRITAYAREAAIGKDLSFSMTTNGTLMNNDVIKYLIDNKVSLLISLDGPEEIHDLNRRFAATGSGSFQTIMENLRRLKVADEDYYKTVSFNMVIDPQNDYDVIQSVFTQNDILKGRSIKTAIVDDSYSIEKNVLSPEFVIKDRYANMLEVLRHTGLEKKVRSSHKAQEYILTLLENMKRNTDRGQIPDEFAPSGPCVPGRTRLLVNVYGDFFPCERVSETSEVMKIGNVHDGFDMNKVNALLNIGALTPEECRNCWCFSRCNLCAQSVDNDTEISGILKLKQCHSVKKEIEDRLRFEILLDEMKNYY